MGRFVKIAVNHEVVSLLGKDGTCTNGTIEFDTCMYSKLRTLTINEVGCTVPWLPDKSAICLDVERSRKAFQIYQKVVCISSEW